MNAESSPGARLVVVASPSKTSYVDAAFELSLDKESDGRGYCIGRGAAAEIRFSINNISRCAVFVRYADGRWWVVDTGETNGVFVNGEQVREKQALVEGDLIGMGPNGAKITLQFSARAP